MWKFPNSFPNIPKFFLIFYLFVFRERRRERETERETLMYVCHSCASPGDLVYNPGMCPDWDLRQ